MTFGTNKFFNNITDFNSGNVYGNIAFHHSAKGFYVVDEKNGEQMRLCIYTFDFCGNKKLFSSVDVDLYNSNPCFLVTDDYVIVKIKLHDHEKLMAFALNGCNSWELEQDCRIDKAINIGNNRLAVAITENQNNSLLFVDENGTVYRKCIIGTNGIISLTRTCERVFCLSKDGARIFDFEGNHINTITNGEISFPLGGITSWSQNNLMHILTDSNKTILTVDRDGNIVSSNQFPYSGVLNTVGVSYNSFSDNEICFTASKGLAKNTVNIMNVKSGELSVVSVSGAVTGPPAVTHNDLVIFSAWKKKNKSDLYVCNKNLNVLKFLSIKGEISDISILENGSVCLLINNRLTGKYSITELKL